MDRRSMLALVRPETLLRFMEVVERAESFAFLTRTLHLVHGGEPVRAAPGTAGSEAGHSAPGAGA